MAIFGAAEMAALQDLCVEEDSGLQASQSAVVSRIGPNASGEFVEDGAESSTKKKTKDPKAIWDDDEIPPEEALHFIDAAKDSRARAKFDMLYKQDVNSEDVYLGTEKTPGSCHCQSLVYKIHFPDHKHSELDVDVTKTTLTAESSRLKLALYLPQPVHAEKGTAKWDDKKKLLVLTLPVDVDEW